MYFPPSSEKLKKILEEYAEMGISAIPLLGHETISDETIAKYRIRTPTSKEIELLVNAKENMMNSGINICFIPNKHSPNLFMFSFHADTKRAIAYFSRLLNKTQVNQYAVPNILYMNDQITWLFSTDDIKVYDKLKHWTKSYEHINTAPYLSNIGQNFLMKNITGRIKLINPISPTQRLLKFISNSVPLLLNNPDYKYHFDESVKTSKIVEKLANHYNMRKKIHEVHNLLKENGWKNYEKILFSTPNENGKEVLALIDEDRLILNSDYKNFKRWTYYTMFDCYVNLKFNGDYIQACMEIDKRFFGYTHNMELIKLANRRENIDVAYVPIDYIEDDASNYIYIKQGNENITIGSNHNFSVISGKAKAGKTTLLTELCSAFISTNEVFGLSAKAKAGKVVYIDTEQSRSHSQKIYQRLMNKYDIDKKGLKDKIEVYNILGYDCANRIEFISDLLRNDDSIRVLIIDGIRDLLNNINDSSESNRLMNILLKWKDLYNIHIITVIHENKTDSSIRGHLGTELVNKAEVVMSISSTMEELILKCRLSRGQKFDTIKFIKKDGGVLVYDGVALKGGNQMKVDELTVEILRELAQQIFVEQESNGYTNIVKTLNTHQKYNIGQSKAKAIIKRLREEGYIHQPKGKKYELTEREKGMLRE